jgi:hypothetical protein
MIDDEDDEAGAVRDTDPSTSVEAALNVPVSKLNRMFVEALQANRPRPMSTTCIANYYGYDRDTFSPRPKGPRGLLAKGLIALWPKKILVTNSAGKTRRMIAFCLPEDLPREAVAVSSEEMDAVLRELGAP